MSSPLDQALPDPPAEVVMSNGAELAPEKRQRKERGSNWGLGEILALVGVKCEEFLERFQVTDARELFDPETTH